jgi:hypothetical protein
VGDLQTIYSPILIPNAFSSGASAIVGNISNKNSNPAFVYTDASDIGLIMVVQTYNNIPLELLPEEHLSARIVADTSWATAQVKLSMVPLPMFALFFFEQKRIVCSVHDDDFKDQFGGISNAHL